MLGNEPCIAHSSNIPSCPAHGKILRSMLYWRTTSSYAWTWDKRKKYIVTALKFWYFHHDFITFLVYTTLGDYLFWFLSLFTPVSKTLTVSKMVSTGGLLLACISELSPPFVWLCHAHLHFQMLSQKHTTSWCFLTPHYYFITGKACATHEPWRDGIKLFQNHLFVGPTKILFHPPSGLLRTKAVTPEINAMRTLQKVADQRKRKKCCSLWRDLFYIRKECKTTTSTDSKNHCLCSVSFKLHSSIPGQALTPPTHFCLTRSCNKRLE